MLPCICRAIYETCACVAKQHPAMAGALFNVTVLPCGRRAIHRCRGHLRQMRRRRHRRRRRPAPCMGEATRSRHRRRRAPRIPRPRLRPTLQPRAVCRLRRCGVPLTIVVGAVWACLRADEMMAMHISVGCRAVHTALASLPALGLILFVSSPPDKFLHPIWTRIHF